MFDFNSDCKNKYYTLYQKIRGEILRGKIAAGEKLPSKRALAQELGVSVVTVQLAYEQLLAEGYIISKERKGYFAEEASASVPDNAPPRPQSKRGQDVKSYKIDFVKGSVPASAFPFATWAKLMRGVLSSCGEHLLERVPCTGDEELKKAVADYLYRTRGMDVNPENVVIGAGAEHLYGIIVQLLGRDNLFAVENPCYGKISSTYLLNGAKIAPVTVKEAGICLDEAEKIGADAFHLSPAHQFPTGAVMPAAARLRLIRRAESTGAYIIEDDYDSEFRLVGKPLQSMYGLCPERVIYINTFSKSLAPSMRLGYMVLPPALTEKYLTLFGRSANIVPLFEQKALAAMLGGGYFERHLSRLKNFYRSTRRALLAKLENFSGAEVIDTGSGPHMIVKFLNAVSDEEIKRRAAEAGINIRCLTDYLIAPQPGFERCAVINYSGVTLKQIEDYGAMSFRVGS